MWNNRKGHNNAETRIVPDEELYVLIKDISQDCVHPKHKYCIEIKLPISCLSTNWAQKDQGDENEVSYCAIYLFPTCWNFCKVFLKLHYVQH